MIDMSLNAVLPLLPELFMAVSALVLLVAGVFAGNKKTGAVMRATMFVFVVTAFLLLGLDWDRTVTLNGFFILDSFAAILKLIILTGLTAVIALSGRYLEQEQMNRFEYPVLVLLSGLGMMLMVSAQNLLALYMALELQSLSLYVLATIRRNHSRSSEAGLKYFVLGALASGMLLFGISLVYGFIGSISFNVIGSTLVDMASVPAGLIVGMVFIAVGLAFKLSAVPFHMWTPDVYEGAPTSVTALFSIVPKVAAIGLLIRVLYEPFGAIFDQWQQIIWFLSAASMILSAFAAIGQTSIKRLMAYSSIGNMGYALIGVAAGTVEGVGSVIVYMTIYMIMTAGVFGIILMMRRGELETDDISELAGFSKNSPLLAYAMAFLMFSMSGIPPMAGFFGKLVVFQAAVASGMYVLAVIGVLSSVVAAYYYLRIIKVMFFDEAADPFDRYPAFALRSVIFLSVLFIMAFILFPDSLVAAGQSAASALFIG